jgi:hypothetical protein
MKNLIMILLLVAAINPVIAQNFSGGLKAGVNIANFTGGDFDNLDKKALVGFYAGGFLNFRLGAVSLQPEVLVSTAGAKFENVDSSIFGYGNSSYRLIYLSVPVMLKYRTAGGFYLEVGPQVGFKLSEDVTDQSVDDFAKNLDLSIGAGLGFQTKGGLGIGGRYIAGLSKVGDFEPSQGVDPDFKNIVIQLGISFPLGK